MTRNRQRNTDDYTGHKHRVRIWQWLGKRRPDQAEDGRKLLRRPR